MKALAVLLCLLIVLDVKSSFSIDDFLNYLQETGYYDIIMKIKYYYNVDIAISFCKEFIKSNDCDLLVRVYIPCRTRGENEEVIPLESIIFYPDNHNIYKGREQEFIGWIKKQT